MNTGNIDGILSYQVTLIFVDLKVRQLISQAATDPALGSVKNDPEAACVALLFKRSFNCHIVRGR